MWIPPIVADANLTVFLIFMRRYFASEIRLRIEHQQWKGHHSYNAFSKNLKQLSWRFIMF